MDDPEARKARRERHAREVEADQEALRESISETERLLSVSDEMLKRHHDERDAADD